MEYGGHDESLTGALRWANVSWEPSILLTGSNIWTCPPNPPGKGIFPTSWRSITLTQLRLLNSLNRDQIPPPSHDLHHNQMSSPHYFFRDKFPSEVTRVINLPPSEVSDEDLKYYTEYNKINDLDKISPELTKRITGILKDPDHHNMINDLWEATFRETRFRELSGMLDQLSQLGVPYDDLSERLPLMSSDQLLKEITALNSRLPALKMLSLYVEDLSPYAHLQLRELHDLNYDMYWDGLKRGVVPDEIGGLCDLYMDWNRLSAPDLSTMERELRLTHEIDEKTIDLVREKGTYCGVYQLLIHCRHRTSSDLNRYIKEEYLDKYLT